jgi:transketolase
LGTDEVAAARAKLGWTAAPFEIPEAHAQAWDQRPRGRKAQQAWKDRYTSYQRAHPELAQELARRLSGKLPEDWPAIAQRAIDAALAVNTAQATRQSSQLALNAIGPSLGELVGGSADLTGSNNTFRKDSRAVSVSDASGNYINYGVREFAMTAIMNGLALHGGFRPYAGTFLTFSDYARNAVRMAALMKQGVILVYTHDSIGLGEDGPTHQPIEHVASLRLMPGLSLWRPCDAVESAVAWSSAVERRHGPTALILTRQPLPQQTRDAATTAAISRGGYTLIDIDGAPEAIVLATGSEVAIGVAVVNALNAAGRRIRLVSMPSTDVFDRQDQAYRDSVLSPTVARKVAIEAGATALWWKYVGSAGRVLGIDSFGASGKALDLYRHFGLTTERLQQTLVDLIN